MPWFLLDIMQKIGLNSKSFLEKKITAKSSQLLFFRDQFD